MTSSLRLILPVTLCFLLSAPTWAQAEERKIVDAPLRRALADKTLAVPSAQNPRSQGGNKPVWIGALTGAGAALALTAAGASKYGENEGGKFCSSCMLQWSAVSVPIGAAIGAGIGYGVKRARRSVTALPVFSRRTAGVVFSASF